MNIEKAIYLNTLTAAEETERKGRVVSAYTAGRIHGGVRFVMRGRGKARLIAAYRALTEQTSLSLDGKPIAVTLRPYTEVELCLDKGEHFFSALLGLHFLDYLVIQVESVPDAFHSFDYL